MNWSQEKSIVLFFKAYSDVKRMLVLRQRSLGLCSGFLNSRFNALIGLVNYTSN